MQTIFFVFIIWSCIRAISYGIFEIKNNNNKPGGIAVISVAIVSSVFTIYILLIR